MELCDGMVDASAMSLLVSSHCLGVRSPSESVDLFPTGLSTEENLSASVPSQPARPKDDVIPLLVTSSSDQFLTTPDGDEKDITQDNSELKHRSSKKDLLEIDRFTICGNRID